ncbi:MAG: CoA-binding protein [Calditrichaeota bacterium]|nr:MAG: CoA-binding protein [Calditrichota bacterium]
MICANTEEITKLLANSKTIALVGASENPSRASNSIGKFLINFGYKVFAVNPNLEEFQGEKCYNSLDEIQEKIDIVDVFRDPNFVLEISEAATRIKAKSIWFQDGVINSEAAELALSSGLTVVQNRCIYRDILNFGITLKK